MFCKNHSKNSADFHCVHCDGYYCAECIKERNLGRFIAYICKQCDGRCENLKELEKETQQQAEIVEARDYWKQLWNVYHYPFRGRGPGIMLRGTITYTFFMWVFSTPFLGLFLHVNVIVLGPWILLCTLACLMHVVEVSAVSDSDEPPDWPDLFIFEDWVIPSVILLLTMGICLTPCLIYFLTTNSKDILFWLLFGCGLYVFPMYLLQVSLKEKFSFLNFPNILKSIERTMVPYSTLLIHWLIIFFVGFLIELTPLYDIFMIGFILRWFIWVYFLYVSMRPLGVFYRVYQDKLVGFDNE